MTSGIKKNFTKDEFLDAIKTSKNHREARTKLGYVNKGAPKGRGRYGDFLKLYSPDLSHFSLMSRSLAAHHDGAQTQGLILESIFNRFLSNCKHHGIEVQLNFKEYITFILSNCFYCGDLPKEVNRLRKVSHRFKMNGIDRIDSKIPYILTNCRSCCSQCNYMKQEYSEKEFFEKIKKIYELHGLNNE